MCALHGDGAADTDGAVVFRTRRRKERRYPELVGPGSRARLVALAIEVGGTWSLETRTFVAQLAKSKARREPRPPAEESRASLEDAVVSHPCMRSGKGRRHMFVGLEVRSRV